MRALLLWLALMLSFSVRAEPVQQAEGSNTASATSIASGAITTTSGNRLIAAAGYFNTTQTTITLSDSQGNTWTACGTQQYDATLDYGIQLFYATVTSAGSTTFTATFGSSSSYRGVLVVEDDEALGALDGCRYAVQTNPGTGTDAVTTGNYSVVAQPSRAYGFVFDWNVNAAPTAGTGWDSMTAAWSGLGAASARFEERDVTSTGNLAATFTSSSGGATSFFSGIIVINNSSSTLEQEGFRWGVDDGNESAHTWEAAQDTSITIAASQSRLLRALVNATGDPSSLAYTLRYQKNGSGGYVAVPVGSTSKATPVIEAADATESGNNTASTSWAVSHPAASTGDLLIFCISWDDSTATTDVTEPAGPNSEVLSEINATPAADTSTDVRAKCWYTVATGSWSASTRTFTPAASEQWTGVTVRVPAGEFDSSTPIGAAATAGTSATSANIQNAALTAGGSDGGGKLITWTAADTNPQTVSAGWTEVANEDRGAVSGGFFSRDTVVSDSESVSAGTVATQTAENSAVVTFVVRAPTVNNEVYITTSANIAAGGEATTARLTAPSGKNSGTDFVTGRRWDDENGTDTTDLTTDDYSEHEWLVALSSTPAASDYFDFRVYSGASAFGTYTVTPRWTIPAAAGGGLLPKMMHYLSQIPANDDDFERRLVANARTQR